MNKDKQTIEEIQIVLDKMAESFAEKDIEKYLKLYAEGINIVIYGSQEGEKWTEVSEYKKSVLKDWKLTEKMNVHYNWLKLEYSNDVGWIASDISFEVFVGNQIMNIPGRFTAVLIKEKNQWKFVQTHFSMAMVNPD